MFEKVIYMSARKLLPRDVASFDVLIKGNYLYVDKTALLHDLMTQGRFYFLSRPRRFGKSLLVSTLKHIFLGDQELFGDCWIGQKRRYDWAMHPVIHLDFSALDLMDVGALEKSLSDEINYIAQLYAIELQSDLLLISRFVELVRALYKRGPVVILVDEYDAPLVKHVTNPILVEQMRLFLSNFYSTIKSLDGYLRFLFLTGVSKFSKTSVFSGMNNLIDISLEPQAAALCGYTQEEVVGNFSPYIEEVASAQGVAVSSVLEQMQQWYNGYRFSRALTRVYNPFSVLYFLATKEYGNYWFASATPTFLVKLIRKNFASFTRVSDVVVDEALLSAFDIDTLPLITLLFQTGYLTIKNYDSQLRLYTLDYPNEEVRLAFNNGLMVDSLEGVLGSDVTVISQKLRYALESDDVAAFCSSMQVLFAHIPAELHIQKEAYYHSLFQMIVSLVGLSATSEVATSVGFIDVVIQTAHAVFVFEFKLNKNPYVALEQIKSRRYYEKYIDLGKKIFLVGLAFSFQGKRLAYAVQSLHD